MSDALLSLKNVVKYFRNGEARIHVLDGANLEVMPGVLVVLLGPSGSGKSTLLHLMGALDVEYQGHVSVRIEAWRPRVVYPATSRLQSGAMCDF